MEEILNRYGSDKCNHHGYHRFYELVLKDMKNEDMNILEIGLGGGQSMKAWEEYFPNARIFIMDISHDRHFDRCRVIRGDQSKASDLQRVIDEVEVANLIIDDGSHVPDHQILTFNMLFTSILMEGGVYIIEDIETSYWKTGSCYGYPLAHGQDHPKNLVNIFKNLIHPHINKEFSTQTTVDDSPISKEARSQISHITFGTNCIIVHKQKDHEKHFFNRTYRFQQNVI